MVFTKENRDVKALVENSTNNNLDVFSFVKDFFPYDTFRTYQEESIKFILTNPHAILNASTGFGKTIVALSAYLPFVKAGYQLIILTRTKSQIFEVILAELRYILSINSKDTKQNDKLITFVPIIGKTSACVVLKLLLSNKDEDICNSCKYYKKYNKFRADLDQTQIKIILENHFSANSIGSSLEEIKNVLKNDYGCPYYIMRILAPHSDIVITTHSFLTVPKLRNAFFTRFVNDSIANKICIIDEIHNFSFQIINSISRNDIVKANELLPLTVWQKILELFNYPYKQIRKPKINTIKLNELIQKNFASNNKKIRQHKNFLIKVLEFFDDYGDIFYTTQSTILQVNPLPERIFEFLSKFDRVIGMSGSLYPSQLYNKFLGLSKYNFRVFEAPLSKRKACYYVIDDSRFTSKFSKRTSNLYRNMAQAISRLHKINTEHTLVIAPSYTFMMHIESEITKLRTEEIFKEPRGRKVASNWFVELLQRKHNIILAVANGKLAEGLELLDPIKGRSLITMVVIAGLPYTPQTQLNLFLRDIYTDRWGFQVAEDIIMKLPMIQAVQQGSGRGIRSQEDYCATVILDHRAVYEKIFAGTIIFRDFDYLLSNLMKFYKNNKEEKDANRIKEEL